ncbi:MAG: deoxyribodipyrimidine photo-lyase [Calditrichaeota bacterium]|nr:MAG: deoxyribodipyrimidine photo-lyase [Calditrichota bacterium]
MIKKGFTQSKIAIFWFRRDLRLEDNAGLFHALQSGYPVLPLFIFDRNILDGLPSDDLRVQFIHQTLSSLQRQLQNSGSSLRVEVGHPLEVWQKLMGECRIAQVFANQDYEPYGRQRDAEVGKLLQSAGIPFYTFQDHVIFSPEDIRKKDQTPYTVFTPYKNRWLKEFSLEKTKAYPSERYLNRLLKWPAPELPALKALGFRETPFSYPPPVLREELIRDYHRNRDFPARNGTSRIGLHLRFGTLSIRRAVDAAFHWNETWLSELIWREFFMMLLYHFPQTVQQPFREKYRGFQWHGDEKAFQRWCEGKTGYPLVDAGMRELNATGYMHNRVRMLTANFLTRLLLIDWRWGEAYFAQKLLDYEQASNVGNWQWCAGCGADAVPYFRIFNPDTQLNKFDPDLRYVKKWVPEYGTPDYPMPIVDYRMARQRALHVYRTFLGKGNFD